MNPISVNFPNEPPSPVFVEKDGFARLEGEFRKLSPSKIVAISDENVWANYGGKFDWADLAIVLPPGEATKSLDGYSNLVRELARLELDRNAVLIGIGGGVITDLVGFAAATFKRGVRFCFVATSLMAQLDAAIGGKCGIDLPEGKNLLGRFARPEAVYCFSDSLATLPEREIRNGIAEAVKYAFIADPSLSAIIAGREMQLELLVNTCVKIKVEIVNKDLFEREGQRSILNFGHTVGHAIEKCQSYAGMLHGEAIAVGMIAEAEIGQRTGFTNKRTRKEIEDLLEIVGLPTRIPEDLKIDDLLKAMANDKKNSNGALAMSLINEPGRCELVRDVSTDVVREVLQRL